MVVPVLDAILTAGSLRGPSVHTRCAFVTYEHQESVSQAIHTANGQVCVASNVLKLCVVVSHGWRFGGV